MNFTADRSLELPDLGQLLKSFRPRRRKISPGLLVAELPVTMGESSSTSLWNPFWNGRQRSRVMALTEPTYCTCQPF